MIAFGIGLICNVELFSSSVIMGVVLFGGRGIIFPYIGFLFARQSRFPTGFYVIYIDKIMMTCTSVFHFSTTNIVTIARHSKIGERY